jgi:predicted NBD/HSP70 family sugar kinase
LTDSQTSEAIGRRRGIAADELRRHNLSAVLDRIHNAGPLSRSQLARQTGLNRSTIRDLISELSDLGLIIEDPGPTGQGPGRPSSVARPLPSGAVVLAVELEVDSLAMATIGLGGHIFGRVRVPHPWGSAGSPATTVAELARLGPGLVHTLPAEHHLVGVGVGVAGVVRRSDGFIHVAPNLGWTDVPLGEMISESLGFERVMLANEADMGALGEFRRGAGRSSRHLIFVAGEVGVGVGIISEGKPMLGASGYAGEAGHMVLNPDGRRCRCGSAGCWETEVGEEALLNRAGIAQGRARSGVIEELVNRALERDEPTVRALDETGRWLGLGIGNLINICNPDRIVIGGFYHELYPFMEDAIKQSAESASLRAPWEAVDIRRGELGEDSLVVGAAELVLAEVIRDPATFGPARPSLDQTPSPTSGRLADSGGLANAT